MKNVHIRKALGVGWSLFKVRPWYLFGLTLAAFGLFALTAGDSVAGTALSYIAYGGYVALLLKHFAGEHIVFDDLFDVVDKRWIYFAFLGLIKGVLIFLGLLCFVIPGVYLAIRWMFAELLVIDKGMRPLEALKASSELTAGVRGKLFLYVVVACLLLIVSILLLIVGTVVAAIVVQFATISLYRELQTPVTEVVSQTEA